MALNHETLGRMRGSTSRDGKTIQFRGIKYANIPGRWQDAVISTLSLSKPGTEFEATKHGPSCPQHPGGFAFDLSLIGDVTMTLEETEQDEFKCLNLVVTTPVGMKREDRLPVFVWVHGGGLFYGSNSWPQYNLAPFVGTSVDIGQPIIGVSINYRLGIFGFLASDELNVSGNLGLRDAACAFRWVKQHISGFGGDPNRITAAGESAGGIMISSLLISSEKDLFNQAITMSGDVTLRRPRNMTWQNSQYDQNVHFLGLRDASPEDQRKAFYEIKAEDLIKILPMGQHWTPTVDGLYLEEEVSLAKLADPEDEMGKPDWCRRILVGDTGDDGTVLKNRIMDNPNIMMTLRSSLREIMTEAESRRLLDAYSLSGDLTKEQHFEGFLNLASELRFYVPALSIQKGWEGKKKGSCLRYHFHQKNSIPGAFKGYASHELDVAYILQNMTHEFPKSHQKFGKEIASAWINFTYGEEWKDIMVLGPDEEITFLGAEEYDEKYRKNRTKLLEDIEGKGGDKCLRLGEMLQGVSGEKMAILGGTIASKT